MSREKVSLVTWTIRGSKTVIEKRVQISAGEGTKFDLVLMLLRPANDKRRRSWENVSLYIRSDTPIENHNLQVSFSLLSSGKKPYNKVMLPDKIIVGEKYGFKNFFSGSKILKSLEILDIFNAITIFCEIKITDKRFGTDKIIKHCVKDYEPFINNEKYSDITIHVEDQKFFAHKVILASKIPHFDAMFSHKMKENNINEVNLDVEYVDSETFSEVLRYVYTEEVENLENLVHKIFKAAHYFQIKELLTRCEQFMKVNISLENVADVIMLADAYDAQDLKKHSLLFITKNFQEVTKLNVLKVLEKSHSHLFTEILNSLAAELALKNNKLLN